jgi:hypothetical protein
VYLKNGLPRNNLSSSIVIPELCKEVGCRKLRVFYMKSKDGRKCTTSKAPGASKACGNPNDAIPRFGFKFEVSKTFRRRLEAAIDQIATSVFEKEALLELFELHAASMEDAATVLKAYNEKTGLDLCLHASETSRRQERSVGFMCRQRRAP